MIFKALDLRKLVPAVLLVLALMTLGIEWRALPEVPGQVWHYLQLMFSSPDWSRLPRAVAEMWRSIAMAWIGSLICVIVSIPLGFLAAFGVGPLWLRQALKVLFAVIRAFPEVVIAIILLTVTGLTPFTGALALGISGIGQQAKWTYEIVESAKTTAPEAIRAAGGTTPTIVRWGLWPACVPAILSFALYRFEISIRTSAVLGIVGAGGIGSMLANYTNYRAWDTVGVLLIVMVGITMIIDAISGRLRRAIMRQA